jgi:hypothetical protein
LVSAAIAHLAVRRQKTLMPIEAIRNKTPAQVRDCVAGFAPRYIQDWKDWLAASSEARPEFFGRILRKWQATRPSAMRRLRKEAQHEGPFLDDLLKEAEEPLRALTGLDVTTIAKRTVKQNEALNKLWSTFSQLRTRGDGSCVGITKAVLLLTDGRIGPAFDSRVRKGLGVAPPDTCAEWLQALEEVGEDIAAFERAHGAITGVVPACFAGLACGRLYDMTLGPR